MFSFKSIEFPKSPLIFYRFNHISKRIIVNLDCLLRADAGLDLRIRFCVLEVTKVSEPVVLLSAGIWLLSGGFFKICEITKAIVVFLGSWLELESRCREYAELSKSIFLWFLLIWRWILNLLT